MIDIETGYIKIVDGNHEIMYHSGSADEVELEVDEYYAIFVPQSMIEDVEIDGEYCGWGENERGKKYHVYGFSDYQSYAYALANMYIE